jgi:hypothetical protein
VEFRAFRSSLARALGRWDARLHSKIARSWAGTDARTAIGGAHSSSSGTSSSSSSTSSNAQSPLLHYVYAEPETLSLGDIPRYTCRTLIYLYIYIVCCYVA